MSNEELIQSDIREILLALGLGDHARPYSAHDVVQREILPALKERTSTHRQALIILGAIVINAGGELRISERDLVRVNPSKLVRWDDPSTNEIVYWCEE